MLRLGWLWSCGCKIFRKMCEKQNQPTHTHIFGFTSQGFWKRQVVLVKVKKKRKKESQQSYIILIRWENRKIHLKMTHPPFQVCDSDCCINDWKDEDEKKSLVDTTHTFTEHGKTVSGKPIVFCVCVCVCVPAFMLFIYP